MATLKEKTANGRKWAWAYRDEDGDVWIFPTAERPSFVRASFGLGLGEYIRHDYGFGDNDPVSVCERGFRLIFGVVPTKNRLVKIHFNSATITEEAELADLADLAEEEREALLV